MEEHHHPSLKSEEIAWLRKREEQCRVLAGQGASPAIRKLHWEMADGYAERARQLTDAPPIDGGSGLA